MDLGITGRKALVLGSGGGLGSAIVDGLLAEGVHIALADRSEERAEGAAERIRAAGGKAFPIVWELGSIDEGLAAVDRVQNEFGPIDILINMTGGPPPSPVVGQDLALWRQNFEMMILSVISVTDRVLPGMKDRRWGRVVTSTSSGVVSPIPNLGLSNALRSSLLGWSKTLSNEVAPFGVTSNIVLPGRIATPRITYLDEKKAERDGRDVENVRRESLRSIPMGRYGTPEEYADVVTFLASEAASYLTGSVLRVDGGYVSSI